MAEGEKSYEELDQEWSELLEELRTVMPGIEVLFGFLLVLPFTNQFSKLTTNQTYVYFAALIAAAIANVLLITPTANHRLRWRQRDKGHMLVLATRTSIAATIFIAFSMLAAVFVITDYLFGSPVTAAVTAVLAALFAWFWLVKPLIDRGRG